MPSLTQPLARRRKGDNPQIEDTSLPVAVTRPGQVWLLGQHRLLCGDSTDCEQVKVLMAGT